MKTPDACCAADRGTLDAQGADGRAFAPVVPHVEKRGDYTVVWLAGTSYEMGYQHGELLHDIIKEAVEFVMADIVLSSLPLIAKDMGILDIAQDVSYPDILDECQGLVDATQDVGFTMDLCLTLNFGDVMLEFVSYGIPGNNGAGPGCSSVIATGEATPDGRLRHSRNLDWGSMNIEIIHHNPVIFVRQPTDGLSHVYVGFPLNISPYTGMNEAGISMGSHEADPAGEAQQSTTGRSHVQMLGQLLKNANSLEDATEFLLGEQHMSTEMVGIADGFAGVGAIFEMTGNGVGVRGLENDVVYATNHFVHPDMVAKHATPATGSLLRLLRFDQLVHADGAESSWGELDEQHLALIMKDMVNPETGQPTPLEELEAMGWDDNASLGGNGPMHFVIFDPERQLFWVTAGKPPVHARPYSCFSLDELLGRDATFPCQPSEL